MHPMLTDFGIARLADSPGLTRTHEFVGTPAYVAPESAEGRPQTSAVDIYGAGILLYELVTGRPPFSGGTALEVLHRHLSEEPRRPTTVPDAAVDGHRALPAQGPGPSGPAPRTWPAACVPSPPASACTPPPAQIDAADWGRRPARPRPGARRGARRPRARPTRPRCCRAMRVRTTRTRRPASCSTPPARDTGRARAGTPTRPRSCRPCRRARTARRSPTGPHPWQSQLQAARDRNEQTQVQYLDPSQDPLRRRPQRQQPRPQQPQQPQQQRPQHQQYRQQPQPQQQYPQRRQQQQYPQQQPQRQQYAPPQQPPPQQPAPRQPREPRQRSANPTKIPGLGCLKGCLFTVVLLFVAGWLDLGTDPAAGLGGPGQELLAGDR